MNWRGFTVTCLLGVVALAALAAWATVRRYEITIGGGTRYYSVIRLDHWTGRTWRLDNTGGWWNEVPRPDGALAPKPMAAPRGRPPRTVPERTP